MSGQLAIYEARALKYWREAQRSQVQLEEYMGTYEEDSGEEGQTRKRPTTMGLRKALAKQREEESAQAQQFPLTELLALEIENDKEYWPNIHYRFPKILERATHQIWANLDTFLFFVKFQA